MEKKKLLFKYLVCHLSFHLVAGQSYQVPLQLMTSKERRFVNYTDCYSSYLPTAKYLRIQFNTNNGNTCSCTTISLLDKE